MTTQPRVGSSEPASVVYDGFISYSHSADDLLAPRLQAGLQKFAKPWWRRRAVRVFRDESSLAANPHLWSSIKEALESSGWFVLLLSPDAAASEWVGKEIEHWKATKPADRILPIVTDGEFSWSDGDVIGSSVPEALRSAFSEEPRWVDLRFARNEEHLDLQNPTFSAAIADIASAIRGVPKDELESEEVRQHRRTVRTAWTAGALVAVLAAAAIGLGIQSTRNAAEARQQAKLAVAGSLASASRAEISADPELAVLLGLQSLREAETYEGSRALGQALLAHRAFLTLEPADGGSIDGGGGIVPALAPGGDLIAILERSLGTAARLELFRITDLVNEQQGEGEAVPIWVAAAGDDRGFWIAAFSADGSELIVFEGPETGVDAQGQIIAVADEIRGGRRLVAFDVGSGEVTRSVPAPPCADPKPMATGRPIDTTLPLLLEIHPELNGECDVAARVGSLGLLDLATGEMATVTESYSIVGFGTGFPSLSQDGKRVAYAQGIPGAGYPPGAVIDRETGEVLLELEAGHSMLSPDGLRVLTGSHRDGPLELWDVDEGIKLREFQGDMATSDFSTDGSTVYGAVKDGSVVLFDAASGERTLQLTGQGSEPIGIAVDEAQTVLASVAVNGTVRLWDIGSQTMSGAGRPDLTIPDGRFLTVTQANGRMAASWTPNDSLFYGAKRVSFYDPSTFEKRHDLPGFLVEISPDGRTAAIQSWSAEPTTLTADEVREMSCVRCDEAPGGDYWEVGTLELIDLETLNVLAEMPGFCTWLQGPTAELFGADCAQPDMRPDWINSLTFSPDGSLLAVGGASGLASVWDLVADEIVWESTKEGGTPSFPETGTFVKFSPDGRFLFVSAFHESFAAVLETSTWEEVAEIPVGDSGFFTGGEFTPDGTLLLLGDNLHQVVVIDTSTWTRLEPFRGQGGNYLPTLAISPSGRFVATGGFDGTVWVWDLEDRAVVQKWQISASRSIYSVSFVDENSLLVIPDRGSQTWTGVVIPLDVETQIQDALTKLTRSFTPEECGTFDIAPCPTLREIKDW